jgi:hypothetical protein
MLEIILVYFLCKRLGDMLRAKGQKPLPYQIMLVVFWIGGEIMGFIVGAVVEAAQSGGAPSEEFNLMGYFMALIGAACGAGLAFLIAYMLPNNQPAPAFGTSPGSQDLNFTPPDPKNPYAPPQTKQ